MAEGTEWDRWSDNLIFQKPDKECDLIMKGGVTSGVVYPPAVLELAEKYRLRSVGGASAGAIAAAAAAAAEYGREKPPPRPGEPAGFAGLYEMMRELGQANFLVGMLQPAPQVHEFFEKIYTLKQRLEARKKAGRSPVPAVLFTVLSLLRRPLRLYRSLRYLASGEASLFGICTGMRGVPLQGRKSPALAPWLHGRLQQLAGLPPEEVLTLGMLQRKTLGTPKDVSINFQMVTTNLSHRQPYILHGESASEADSRPREFSELDAWYLFHEEDMARLFPSEVVRYLVEWTRLPEHREQWERDNPFAGFTLPEKYHPFPRGNALPVVVATRMSLSFPVLLSAVRLFSIKRRILAQPGTPEQPRVLLAHDVKRGTGNELEENWFSDGGIASNFPIHMFDAWIPTRPTFGINLADSQLPRMFKGPFKSPLHPHEESDDAAPPSDVFLPSPERLLHPNVYPMQHVISFLGAIFDTAQNYRDTTLSRMPSYRERVVQVSLKDNEGGLNLDMPPDVIQGIEHKGLSAAQALEKDFDFDHHRWVRLLVLQARLEREFDVLRENYMNKAESRGVDRSQWAQEMSRDYDGLLRMQLGQAEAGTPWYKNHDEPWCQEARDRMRAFIWLMKRWSPERQRWRRQGARRSRLFTDDAPMPEGVLRVTPQN